MPIQMVIIGIQVGLGIATTAVISRAIGAGKTEYAKQLGGFGDRHRWYWRSADSPCALPITPTFAWPARRTGNRLCHHRSLLALVACQWHGQALCSTSITVSAVPMAILYCQAL
ncbi:hypothetical protein ASZ87_02772 [Vibrio cholerae]|nr:hypothetical protein ASZ87_02772 [Vibrio cholerae]